MLFATPLAHVTLQYGFHYLRGFFATRLHGVHPHCVACAVVRIHFTCACNGLERERGREEGRKGE